MTVIDIEYCVPCGLLPVALQTERALLDEFGQGVNGVTLRPGHRGVFKVCVDDEVVWDKDIHGGDLDLNLLTEAIRERAPVAQPIDHHESNEC